MHYNICSGPGEFHVVTREPARNTRDILEIENHRRSRRIDALELLACGLRVRYDSTLSAFEEV
jgi:hypothetical protein